MKTILFCLIFILFITGYVFASIQTKSGEVLLINTNASLSASGNAGIAALHNHQNSVSLNPAFISLQDKRNIIFSFNRYIESVNQQEINYFTEINNKFYGFGISYINYGSFQRTLYNEITGDYYFQGDFSASDIILKAYIPTPEFKDIITGFSIKFLREKIDNYNANAFMIDAGAVYEIPESEITVGVSIQNFGTKMKFNKESYDLPLLFRTGTTIFIPELKTYLNCDWQKIKNNTGEFLLGLQFLLNNYLQLNAGFNNVNDAGKGYSAGFDLSINNMEIQYAFEPYDNFNSAHRFTFIYDF